jgi:hypothetical protein
LSHGVPGTIAGLPKKLGAKKKYKTLPSARLGHSTKEVFAECPQTTLGKELFTECFSVPSAALGKKGFAECPIFDTRQSLLHSAKAPCPVVIQEIFLQSTLLWNNKNIILL